jgi:hypothetical protein
MKMKHIRSFLADEKLSYRGAKERVLLGISEKRGRWRVVIIDGIPAKVGMLENVAAHALVLRLPLYPEEGSCLLLPPERKIDRGAEFGRVFILEVPIARSNDIDAVP